MIPSFHVFPCLITAALGLAPAIPPLPALSSGPVVSTMTGAYFENVKTQMGSVDPSANAAVSLRGSMSARDQSPVQPPRIATRIGYINEPHLKLLSSKSQRRFRAAPEAKAWSTLEQQPSEARFNRRKRVRAVTTLVSSWMFLAAAGAGLWWRQRTRALIEKDSQTEMAVHNSVAWLEEPNFAIAAFTGKSVEARQHVFDPGTQRTARAAAGEAAETRAVLYRALTKINVRLAPDANSPSLATAQSSRLTSGEWIGQLQEGQVFRVTQTTRSGGQTFLKLDGQDGWVFSIGIAGAWKGKAIVAPVMKEEAQDANMQWFEDTVVRRVFRDKTDIFAVSFLFVVLFITLAVQIYIFNN